VHDHHTAGGGTEDPLPATVPNESGDDAGREEEQEKNLKRAHMKGAGLLKGAGL
jgi:hypothetical protein